MDSVINSTDITTAKDKFCLIQNKLKKLLAGASVQEDQIMSKEEREEVGKERKELKKEGQTCKDKIINRNKSKNTSNSSNDTIS